MPLCRYQIRHELSLADRELYNAADKNDPEALLEGFAMARLVGALRQLGDLAEFAAEIFSDLHEEVAATAARSQGVMVRVQHLEMEIPLIEKTFLKQTNHSSFFYRAGVDWHRNMHTKENCITKGDMPQFITDSYEETRAPPSFIFLDRFDVGGDGACLKRYTDPSFFKADAAALGTTNSDVHGEKNIYKGKRRGTQWRNGRTLKALPTSHAKLHQLLWKANIEDNVSDQSHHVKLKRRLNDFPFDLKTDKSYMEKILKDRTPDHELLNGVSIGSVGPVPCDLNAELERQFNGSESLDIQLTNRNQSQQPELKNGVSYHILGANNSSSNLQEDVGEKKIIVDRESNATMVSYQSDDATSEVEIYVDTLASEPQIYSNPKLVTKKQVPGLDVARSIHLEADISNAYPIDKIIEAKSTSRQLKWRGCAGGNDMTDNIALSSDNTGQTVSNVIPAQMELNQCEMETGVFVAREGKLLLKSYLKQRENSNDLDQEEYHIISPLSVLENLKTQQSSANLLKQEKDTINDAGMPDLPLGLLSPVLNVLPEAVKINQEEVPPPPPLPPVQGRGNQPISTAHVNVALSDNKGPSLSRSMTKKNTPHHASMGKDLPLVHAVTSGNSVHDDPLSSLAHIKESHGDKLLPSLGKLESITQKLPLPANLEMSQHDDHIEPNSTIILQGTTADVTAAGDTGQTRDLAVMNQQKGAQIKNSLIDSITAHDKTKLKKVTEQAGVKVQVSDDRDSLLEQIRAKAFNLRPTTVQRPNIQGPTTNLRVSAILEKAKTIRHAFSGSDEDTDDSWSD